MSEKFVIKQALISVSDKNKLEEVSLSLQNNKIPILASGGTAKLLQTHHIKHQEISAYTSQNEILDGRVKTLHPKIFGGILARDDNPEDLKQLITYNIQKINLVIVNCYPFEQKLQEFLKSQHENQIDNLIEFIDIGGPSLIRAAAKNYKYTLVITNPDDYQWLINKLNNHSIITLAERLEFANKAFNYTADYDKQIAEVFSSCTSNREKFPKNLNLNLSKISDLRYGENPEQQAAVYSFNSATPGKGNRTHSSLANPELIQGKALSYNNLLDSNTAINVIKNLNQSPSLKNLASCVIIKHATPCGVACSNSNIKDAYNKAFAADSRSAFGGVIAINQTLSAELADTIISNQFVEVIICPTVDPIALNVIGSKPNIRLIKYDFASTDNENTLSDIQFRTIHGGLLAQTPITIENLDENTNNFEIITHKNNLTKDILLNLKFAWHVVQNVKSNAIVLANNLQTVGIGTGQTSRVGSLELAAHLAKSLQHKLSGCVMASDAFFPFPDSIELAHQLGIKAIIQPGGSKQDTAVIAKANELNISMVLTHKRKFYH